jgi:hypothetical protein
MTIAKTTKLETLKKIAIRIIGKDYSELTFSELASVNRMMSKAVTIQEARLSQGWL